MSGQDVNKERGPTEWAAAAREVREVDFEVNAYAVRIGGGGNGALDIATWIVRVGEGFDWECSCVDQSNWVVGYSSGIAKGTGDWNGVALSANETQGSQED